MLVDVGLCRRVAGFTACGTERVGRLNVEGDLDVICKARDRSSVEPVSCSAVLVSSIVEELYFSGGVITCWVVVGMDTCHPV